MTYTPTPEAVEVAARASYESFMARMTRHFAEHGVTLRPARPWEEVSDVDRETFREDATAALAAAGPLIAAQALREAAGAVRSSIATEPRLMHVVDWTEGIEYAERLLRDRADHIEKEDA